MKSRLFDYYISVDWSAKASPSPKKPSPDSIWVGERSATGASKETYFRTRYSCRDYLIKRLVKLAAQNKRIWIGFDFSYGYPQGFAYELGLPSVKPWSETWELLDSLLEDNEENQNNRFRVASTLNSRIGAGKPGPFFGHPNGRSYDCLELTFPKLGSPYPGEKYDLQRWRICDKRLRGIQPVWKLIGPGSVGSQGLVGIPILKQITTHRSLQNISKVWPFQTGFIPPVFPQGESVIIHSEIFPSLVNHLLDPKIQIKDHAQVRALSKHLCSLDSKGLLAELFTPPEGITKQDIEIIENEEGWILGTK